MLKKLIKEKLRPLHIKVNEADEKRIKKLALEFTNGNVSEWMRYAAMRYRPKKKDLAI